MTFLPGMTQDLGRDWFQVSIEILIRPGENRVEDAAHRQDRGAAIDPGTATLDRA